MVDAKHEAERRVQWAQVLASVLSPIMAGVFAVILLTRTIDANFRVQQRSELAQARIAAAQTLAETGATTCAIAVVDGFFSGGLNEVGEISALPLSCEDEVIAVTVPSVPVQRELQRELIRQLIDHPEQQAAIFAMWRTIYGPDTWIESIESALESS
jgi:hypothetical protein